MCNGTNIEHFSSLPRPASMYNVVTVREQLGDAMMKSGSRSRDEEDHALQKSDIRQRRDFGERRFALSGASSVCEKSDR